MNHIVTFESKGLGFTELHTPVCTCGWKGRGLENYNDWKWTILNEQKQEHLDKVSNDNRRSDQTIN